MPAYSNFPDLEALAADVIRDGIVGSRVYSSVPKTPTWPLVIVKRIGGVPVNRKRLDRASLQIEVWGNSKSEARDLAHDARMKLLAAEGVRYTIAGGDVVDAWVAAVDDETGLTWLPDPVTNRDRYIFGVAITAHI